MKHLARCLFILILALPFKGQDRPAPFVMRVNSDFMELHVSVVDEKDRNVGGLTMENFRIKENGIPQPITIFKHEDIPVSLGLVIDNSRSIEPRKNRLDAATLAFVRQSHPEDESFIVHFDSDARLERDFTTKLSDLEDTLAASKPFGQTAIYDALMVALDHMQKANHQKKALLLVTDGLDNASQITFGQVLEAVKHSRVAIIVVGLLSAAEGREGGGNADQNCRCQRRPRLFSRDVDQARAMMERAAHDLRTQYTIGYVPSDPAHDGSWRSVRVELIPPAGSKEKLDADYRHGYYRPTE